MREKLLERFLRYVQFDTRSDESSSSVPSTPGQTVFASVLCADLERAGLSGVKADHNGYVTATLPSNVKGKTPVVGFISHMDTSPDAPSNDIRPLVHRNYDGGDLVLDAGGSVVLSPREFRELKRYTGQTIITAGGNTLLGADDKAGIAEIVTAMEYLVSHPEIKHGTVRVGFTPDEEIGRGADHFDVKDFGADYAYTVDGGAIGELEYENFNAASLTVTIRGRSVHPGSAKGTMINSIRLAREFDSMLPGRERPEHTEGYSGFFHLHDIRGNVEETVMKYIIRDHDAGLFRQRIEKATMVAAALGKKHRGADIRIETREQYRNMKEIIEQNYYIIEKAVAAYRKAGIEPVIKPVRGGTDGSRLSFMGLPCPNIFTGGHNYHGRYEFVPLESMVKAAEVIVNLSMAEKKSK